MMPVIKEKEHFMRVGNALDEDFLLKRLLESPLLLEYFEEIKQTLEEERKKRQQFYSMISADQKAEFINGEGLRQSPAKLRHSMTGQRLFILLSEYVTMKNLAWVGYEKVMISLTRNDYEPDICFFCHDKARLFDPDQWQFPAPDFIAEVVSESTEERDRGVKFTDYAVHGVTEYWIIDPIEQTIEQYRLQGTGYKLLRKVDAGKLKSIVVEGFEIPVRAIFDDVEKRRALQGILSSGK